ncbi:hypothetical protein FDECE_10598 [Fusarium decemcellulare]|nr:hypothetical protein FDECE_10598 [Fusarium decemcellulare]
MNSRRPLRPKSRDEFEIAIICALPLEADAILGVFDYHWDEDDGLSYGKARGDPNAYSTGVIGHHNVVLAHLPGMGKAAAANVAPFCRMSFPNISLALVVGVCGGAPIYNQQQILLGDVIISTAVVQPDFGRQFPDKFVMKDTLSESPGRPGLEVAERDPVVSSEAAGPISWALQGSLISAKLPTQTSGPVHFCGELGCDPNEHLPRFSRHPRPMIHFGTVACGDTVMKSGEDRDRLTKEKNVIAFEMESVGVWDVFPCVVVKGVCDYADSHKNKHWQPYAAASAAACTKAFLQHWTSTAHETRAQLEAQERDKRLLNSLKFPEMNARKNAISSEAPTTFRWIFRHGPLHNDEEDTDTSSSELESLLEGSDDATADDERSRTSETTTEDNSDYDWSSSGSDDWSDEPQWDSFRDWLECDQPVYWISGKPGSGKSTLMKFIFSDRRTKPSLDKWRRGAVIVSHFFWKPGSIMQHSLKGCLCSLLYQILSQDEHFLRQQPDIIRFRDKNSPSDWDLRELDRLLVSYGEQSSRPLCIFIDALDEVSLEQDVVDLLMLVKRLDLPGIKICVSSRPDRLFRFHLAEYPGLRIHDLTRNDIVKYSENTIRDSISHRPRGLAVSKLALKIATLADGVFLWAVLVTRSLIRGINNGDSPTVINQRLRATPRDLMDLYRDILSRSEADRPIYQKDASLIFNLVLISDSGGEVTLFQLVAATNDALLNRYTNHEPQSPELELNAMCQRILVLLEVGCAGLLNAIPDPAGHGIAHCYVSPSHRTARDFLFETEEGRSLWDKCELTQEELLIKRTKALLAEYWLLRIVLYPRPTIPGTSGVFSKIKSWARELKLPYEFVAVLLKLVQMGHERGCPLPSEGAFSLMPKDPTGRFLVDAARRDYHEFVEGSLMTLETTRAADIANCILFDRARGGSGSLPHRSGRDIEFMGFLLKNGGNPNWVETERHGEDRHPEALRSTRSIWLQYLVQLLFRLVPSTPKTPPRGPLTETTLEMFRSFIDAGARMDSVTTVGLNWSRSIIRSPLPPDSYRVIFETNAKCLVEILLSVMGVSDFELGPNETASYIRALAFGNWHSETVFVVESEQDSETLLDPVRSLLRGADRKTTSDDIGRAIQQIVSTSTSTPKTQVQFPDYLQQDEFEGRLPEHRRIFA